MDITYFFAMTLTNSKTQRVFNNLEKINRIRKTFYPTPIYNICVRYKGRKVNVYAKNESLTFSGSIKDRMVMHIIEKSYLNETLNPDDAFVEVTSGSTGIALSTFAAYLGHKVEIFIPDWLSDARYKMMDILGAKVNKVSREEGGFVECRKRAFDVSKKDGYFYVSQFDNKLNMEAHESSTAPEFFLGLSSVFDLGKTKFVFSSGVGTGGTIIGMNRYSKKMNINCKCVALEPESSPILKSHGKEIGFHRIEGIADDFVPENCIPENELFKEISLIKDGDAILAAKMLNAKGLHMGISSGANLLSALDLCEKSGFEEIPITIFCDGSLRYISTDLFKEEAMRDDYLSKDLEIFGIEQVI